MSGEVKFFLRKRQPYVWALHGRHVNSPTRRVNSSTAKSCSRTVLLDLTAEIWLFALMREVRFKCHSVHRSASYQVLFITCNSNRTIGELKKSAAKFHYIKTLSGKVVAQSIAFRVVSIYWQVVVPFPWYLNAKGPTRIGSTCVAHTSPHSRRLGSSASWLSVSWRTCERWRLLVG